MSKNRMSWFALCVFLGLVATSCPSRAQTITATNTQPAPCFYCPGWVSIVGTARLVTGTLSATSPSFAGPPVAIPALTSSTGLNLVFDMTFPSPSASSTVIVSGIYLLLQPTGGGIVFGQVVEIYPMTLTVAPGNTVTVHYESPAPPGSPFVTANAIAPPPPPPPTVTADGTRMPPATQLLDASGAKWTIATPFCGSDGAAGQVQIFRNGVRQFCSIDFATIKAGVVYVSDFGSGPGWQKWNGTSFVVSPAP